MVRRLGPSVLLFAIGCAGDVRTLMAIDFCEDYVDHVAAAGRRCGETLPDAELRREVERLVTGGRSCAVIDEIDRPSETAACLAAIDAISCGDLAAGAVPSPCLRQLVFYE